jgi:hypothetical protein
VGLVFRRWRREDRGALDDRSRAAARDLELWDAKNGARLEAFTWMEGDNHPRAPAWVLALRAENSLDADSKTHICTTTP